MAKQRFVNTKFWSDSFISDLDPLERYLFLYFLTNEHTNIAGLYELPLRTMAFETGIEKDMLLKMLPGLSEKIVYVDGWIWVKNFQKHQYARGNSKVKIGIENSLKEIPDKVKQKVASLSQESIPLQGTSTLDLDSDSDPDSDLDSDPNQGEVAEKNSVHRIVDLFFELKGWSQLPKEEFKKRKIVYGRHTKAAKDILSLSDDYYQFAEDRVRRVATWAGNNELEWGLDTVIKKWMEIDDLPQEKKKKPVTEEGYSAYEKQGKWFCIMPNGEHKEVLTQYNKIRYV
jgi:hypothetical protein